MQWRVEVCSATRGMGSLKKQNTGVSDDDCSSEQKYYHAVAYATYQQGEIEFEREKKASFCAKALRFNALCVFLTKKIQKSIRSLSDIKKILVDKKRSFALHHDFSSMYKIVKNTPFKYFRTTGEITIVTQFRTPWEVAEIMFPSSALTMDVVVMWGDTALQYWLVV